jgi:hypothetical protein
MLSHAVKRLNFALWLVIPLVLAACGSTDDGQIEYTDPERLSLLKLPGDWNLYEEPDLDSLEGFPFMPELQGFPFPAQSVVAFDGAPSPDVENLGTDLATATYPIGTAAVRSISDANRDHVSRFLLSQSVLNYASFEDIQEVTKEDFSFGEGYEGVRRLVAYTSPDGLNQGVAYLISVTNPNDDRMYSVVAGCSFECFTSNQEEIEQVVDSWLVNTKG